MVSFQRKGGAGPGKPKLPANKTRRQDKPWLYRRHQFIFGNGPTTVGKRMFNENILCSMFNVAVLF